MICTAEIMAGIKNLGRILILVRKRVAQSFDGSPGAEIRTADADDNQGVRIGFYAIRCLFGDSDFAVFGKSNQPKNSDPGPVRFVSRL